MPVSIDPQLLQDLQRQSRDEIRRLRTHDRIETRIDVVLHAGSASALPEFQVHGHTEDLSKGGCRAVFPRPPVAGDVYRFCFPAELGLPTIFARCLRTRFVREESFEGSFMFFSEIQFPESLAPRDDLLD